MNNFEKPIFIIFSFTTPGIKNVRDLASVNDDKELSGKIFFEKYDTIITFAEKIDQARFKTWLLDNNIEHFKTRFEEMGISSLYGVLENLEILKEVEFLDAYHALYSLESNKNKLESYGILHDPSTAKSIAAWIRFICEFYCFDFTINLFFCYFFFTFHLRVSL